MILPWIQRANDASRNLHNGKGIFDAYTALLTVVWREGWNGACHDTSAMLYMLLREQGYSPALVTGEVKAADKYLDHSWVEVEGKIYDVAVGFPHEDGVYVGPSVFASLNLDTGEPTNLSFGVRSPGGIDEIAQFVADATLSEYSEKQHPQASIWAFTPVVGHLCGLALSSEALRRKYGAVTRELRGQDAPQ